MQAALLWCCVSCSATPMAPGLATSAPLPRGRPLRMRSCGRLLAPHARAASTAAIDTSPKKAIEYCVAHVRSVHPLFPLSVLSTRLLL
jgi:hypothetical protein